MNEALKKYVNAYIDGEEVELRYDNVWNKATSLSDFDNDKASFYRIKPKPTAEEKWQRVINEGYLCKFSNITTSNPIIDYLEPFTSAGYNSISSNGWHSCEVIREKGHKQPYFQGDDIPKIEGKAVIYYKDGDIDMTYAGELHDLEVDWSEVVAYIEV